MTLKPGPEIAGQGADRAVKQPFRAFPRRPSMHVLALIAAGLYVVGPLPAAKADPNPQSQEYFPKPAPLNGDTVPFLPLGSSTTPSAPTLGVIGDSVARDYAYYLARELGPDGVRVVDGAIPNCPAGTLPLIERARGGKVLPRGGACPKFVLTKQSGLVTDFHPKVILWHSMVEIYDVYNGQLEIASGSPEWERRVLAQWEDTLTRITRNGAQVVTVMPLWYEHNPPVPLNAPGPSIEKLRDLYTRWASRHRDHVTLVDVAPVACPSGPPCGPVNGVEFRPDNSHFSDAGGSRVAAYLKSHVPALARLSGAG
ncbi:MAG: hypothetical protein JWN52_932 [Actinomycetia bacterium]|nr:hypothetical protein [Actinomycetes bacterium]